MHFYKNVPPLINLPSKFPKNLSLVLYKTNKITKDATQDNLCCFMNKN